MGKYDDISAEQLRDDLVAFATLILRLDAEDGVLTSPADLQSLLGELRRKLFAYEVRATRRFQADSAETGDDATESGSTSETTGNRTVSESMRIVREALRREEELLREWNRADPNGEDERD